MKRVILGLAILVTASNLAVGVAYAAACLGTNGRNCGSKCVSMPDGSCECTGSCSSSESAWVNAGREKIAEVEMNAY